MHTNVMIPHRMEANNLLVLRFVSSLLSK